MSSPIVVASNRGPVAFVREDGRVVERRGVGGLVTAVGGAVRGRDVTWIAAAITDEDRARAGAVHDVRFGGATARVRLADIPPDRYALYYNEFSNRILWFLHHYLWDKPRAPALGASDAAAWDAFRDVNGRFAELVAEEAADGGIALPQDYHLSLAPDLLRKHRPDLRIALFWHIPFCQPDQYRVLPDRMGSALLDGLLAADLIGFQTERWAQNFIACCRQVLGARVRGRAVSFGDRTVRVGSYPIGVNREHLAEEAARPEVERAVSEIDEIVGDRALVLRVDRTELSKNILRGLRAYEMLLERRRDLHERIVHLVLLTPSRRGVPEYEEYTRACVELADRVNERFATGAWQPIVLEIADDFPRTLAAYCRYDVLVVNPVYDGMNLVAREGPLLNERDGVLVLSRNAGAAVELAPASLVVNPFDADETAAAIEEALEMPADGRRERAARLRKLAQGTLPERWLDHQLRDLERATS